MKYRRTNKVGKFEVKKVKNKGAVSKNVVRVAISHAPRNCSTESNNERAVLNDNSPNTRSGVAIEGRRLPRKKDFVKDKQMKHFDYKKC